MASQSTLQDKIWINGCKTREVLEEDGRNALFVGVAEVERPERVDRDAVRSTPVVTFCSPQPPRELGFNQPWPSYLNEMRTLAR